MGKTLGDIKVTPFELIYFDVLTPTSFVIMPGKMTIESFRELRDDYESEVPEVVVHSGPFKVRRAWWQSLIFDLESGLRNGTIPEGLAGETKELVEYIKSE